MALDATTAVRAAAERLDACDYILWCEATNNDEANDDYNEAVDQLLAPFCGCNGCMAREAIHAAIEPLLKAFLTELSINNENPDGAPCCVVGKRAWDYHVALLDISLGTDNPKDRALKALGMKKEKP